MYAQNASQSSEPVRKKNTAEEFHYLVVQGTSQYSVAYRDILQCYFLVFSSKILEWQLQPSLKVQGQKYSRNAFPSNPTQMSNVCNHAHLPAAGKGRTIQLGWLGETLCCKSQCKDKSLTSEMEADAETHDGKITEHMA